LWKKSDEEFEGEKSTWNKLNWTVNPIGRVLPHYSIKLAVAPTGIPLLNNMHRRILNSFSEAAEMRDLQWQRIVGPANSQRLFE